MRCLTLADALRARGAETRILSRHLPAALERLVRNRQHGFSPLEDGDRAPTDDLAHSRWLGVSQEADAAACAGALAPHRWDWIVVDHYGIDARWEREMRHSAATLLAIDDLADRRHACDLLLDQNYHVNLETRYRGLVDARVKQLLGPAFALLRDEFREQRASLRQRAGSMSRVLIFFGGSDIHNFTRRAIDGVVASGVAPLTVDVVIGAQHPDTEGIAAACGVNGFTCHRQTSRMAALMAAADLAIGASGSASWERCCLGLPAICVATAANQMPILAGLEALGAIVAMHAPEHLTEELSDALRQLTTDRRRLEAMSAAAAAAVDGCGVDRVAAAMEAA